jgi:hypothetical protein
MCPLILVFVCSFNMTVLHHITVVKYVNCCLKIILDAGLVTDVKLQFPGLHAHLTWILSILSVAIFENEGLCHYNRQRNCGVEFSNLEVK